MTNMIVYVGTFCAHTMDSYSQLDSYGHGFLHINQVALHTHSQLN